MKLSSPQLSRRCRPALALLALLAAAPTARAQWATESYTLKPGWNAIWLPLDVSHEAIVTLAAADIEELWRWNANEAGTFTDTPAGPPSQTELQWNVWRRTDPLGTTLNLLTGNAAYLVKVSDTAPATQVWNVKGKPLPPKFEWSSTGLNFVGFPTQNLPLNAQTNPNGAAAPTIERFFGFDAVLSSLPLPSDVLYYAGGPLSDVAPRNPRPLTSFNTAMTRNAAYWVKATQFTNYYGPVKVEVNRESGLSFGDDLLSVSVRLTNTINLQQNQTVTVRLTPLASEAAPAGQAAVAGSVPLMVRGALNLTTGQYAYDPFTAATTRALAPGQSTDVVFTVNRSAMTGTSGTAFQSLVQITDTLNQTRINLPVSATVTPRSGLWGGAAAIIKVDRILGNTAAPNNVARPFPLRLIIHTDAAGNARLLQQAYLGEQDGQPAVAAAENAFTAPGKAQARVSSSHFPTGLKLTGTGTTGLTGNLTFTVPLAHTDKSNPFLHAYHPDHDNLDERFEQQLPAGKEAPEITRSVTLSFDAQNQLGFDPAWGATTLGGTYTETITGLRDQPVTVSGSFYLQRASDAATFLQP